MYLVFICLYMSLHICLQKPHSSTWKHIAFVCMCMYLVQTEESSAQLLMCFPVFGICQISSLCWWSLLSLGLLRHFVWHHAGVHWPLPVMETFSLWSRWGHATSRARVCDQSRWKLPLDWRVPSCGNQHKCDGNEIMPALFKEPWKPKSQSQRLLINLHPVIVGCCWPNSKKLLLLSTYDESLPSAQEKVLSFLISCKKNQKIRSGRFLRVWNSFPQGKRFSGVEKVPWICCWTPLQFRNPASRREVRHSGTSIQETLGRFRGIIWIHWVDLTCLLKGSER